MPLGRAPATVRVQLPDGEDTLAVEEPLEIRVNGLPVAVTMRTPGDDLDLALGFLTTEGVLDGRDGLGDVRAMGQVSDNVVDILLADGVSPARARSADRELYATSSCGICGKASIDRILRGRVTPMVPANPTAAFLAAVLSAFDAAQVHTQTTGCMHAAGLFRLDAPAVLVLREDVGRHNAVDKVLGAWLRDPREGELGFELLGLVVTSRAGFEVVQKAIGVGISLVCSAGAPTSLAVDVAREAGCALIGWLRPGRGRRYG